MINNSDKEEIRKEFRKIILEAEKNNLSQLQLKGDYQMVESLYTEFEKVVKNHENNSNDN